MEEDSKKDERTPGMLKLSPEIQDLYQEWKERVARRDLPVSPRTFSTPITIRPEGKNWSGSGFKSK